MSLIGIKDGVEFRSTAGAGRWIPCNTLVGSSIGVGARPAIQVPPNLESDLNTRGWKGQCPAYGVLVQGSVTADNGGPGAAELFASRTQVLDFVSVQMSNRFKNPYSRQWLTLAQMEFLGQAINPRANALDTEFYDDDAALTVFAGQDPLATVAPDIATAGTPFKQFGTRNPDRYPALDWRDSYWRGLEGRVQIRADAAGVTTSFAYLASVPLALGTGALANDVVPLGTIVDPTNPWQLQVQVNQSGEGRLIHAAAGGAFSITSIGLYLYVIPVRKEDAYRSGILYTIRTETRSQSPLRYQADQVVIFTGNIPTSQSALVDTVDGVTYVPGIEFPYINGDFEPNNASDWYVADQVHFPPHDKFRSPREVYERIWNRGTLRPRLRTGLPGEASIFAGRALVGRGYPAGALEVDAGIFETQLGAVSSAPCRVMAMTALDLEGFPGFGYIPQPGAPPCTPPYISLEGTYNFNSADPISALNQMTDVVINTSEQDRTLVQSLGKDCCTKGGAVFIPRVDNPDSPKAQIVAGKVTTWVEDTTTNNAALALAQNVGAKK